MFKNNFHTDHLNTPRAITDTSNNLKWSWENKEAFGNNQPDENVSGSNFKFNLRFPGQYFDIETGLNYNINRDYNPVWGRYMTSDPLGLSAGLNTYGYVEGNSLKYIDPTGEFLNLVIGAASGVFFEVISQGLQNYVNDCNLLDFDNYDLWDIGVSGAIGTIGLPGVYRGGEVLLRSKFKTLDTGLRNKTVRDKIRVESAKQKNKSIKNAKKDVAIGMYSNILLEETMGQQLKSANNDPRECGCR